jgi:hydrogenase maturation protein HypF
VTGQGGISVRVRLQMRGRVQGVGFRPLIYRLAQELGLAGWVKNDNRGVVAELEGDPETVREFERRLQRDVRAPARIDDLSTETIACEAALGFAILPSSASGSKETTLLADIAPCADCLADFTDPNNRRFLYPFTNCTHCGPRFTIIRALPYDRPNTTMVRFVQCDACKREYDDPADRRFHAQPNACPACGPAVTLIDADGKRICQEQAAVVATADAVLQGQVIALEGIGGFQFIVDARNDAAVQRLRERKHRWEKPLAVMVANLEAAQVLANIDADEAALLISPEAPIVLLRRRADATLAESLAPNNPYVGLMLPSSPLHHLLMARLGIPVVATSGNLSEEPICIHPHEALERLVPIADLLLVHNRPIERHADDSVAAVVAGEAQLFRRARGYAPLPIPLGSRGPVVLALGGHLKNTVALSVGDQCFVSQHIGDLESVETRAAHLRVVSDFLRLYETRPAIVAHDLHPDYASTLIAEELTARGGMLEGIPRLGVQHHHAHLASCLTDAGTAEPVLGIVWDGSGFGTDRTSWGGEFLFGNALNFERVACLQPFLLPGGDRSARSPRRIAAALLYQFLGADWLGRRDLSPIAASSEQELLLMRDQIDKRILSPYTSSIGRLFDAVSSLLDLHQDVTFEGQAAMALEFVADRTDQGAYPLVLVERTLVSSESSSASPEHRAPVVLDAPGPTRPGISPRFYLDPTSMLHAMLAEKQRGVAPSLLAARFHGSLVNAAVEVARRVGVGTVALSGGCFQNRLLLERCRTALALQGHRVLTHHQVPTNDGGLALGQVAVARSHL